MIRQGEREREQEPPRTVNVETGRAETAREFADHILERFRFVTVKESGDILCAQEDQPEKFAGVYREKGEVVIEAETERIAPRVSNHFVGEVIGHIRRLTYVSADDFDADLNELNLLNGRLNILTGELRSHDPLFLSRIQLPVAFDAEATCPRIMKFLERVLPNSADRLNVLEDAATCLIRDARFQKAFMYIGNGGNGKSTWRAVLTALLGEENISGQSIHNLAVSRFAAASVEGALANMYPDIESDEITLTGRLKAIIGGDRFDIERKGVDPYSITPFAKLFYLANTLPQVNDNTDAWFRRWRITNWSQRIPESEMDPILGQRLTTPGELSGLLNVLVGLARALIARNGFTNKASVPEVRAEWGDRANVIQAFKTSQLVTDSIDAAVPAHELYAAYVRFCQGRGFIARSQKAFMEDLKAMIPITPEDRKPGGKGSKSVRYWVGLRLRGASTLDGSEGSNGSEGSLTGVTSGKLSIEGNRKPSEPSEPSEPALTDDALRAFRSWGPKAPKTPRASADLPSSESPPSVPLSPEPNPCACSCGAGPFTGEKDQTWIEHRKVTGHTDLVDYRRPKP